MGERTIAVSFPVAATLALVLMVYLQGKPKIVVHPRFHTNLFLTHKWAIGIPKYIISKYINMSLL